MHRVSASVSAMRSLVRRVSRRGQRNYKAHSQHVRVDAPVGWLQQLSRLCIYVRLCMPLLNPLHMTLCIAYATQGFCFRSQFSPRPALYSSAAPCYLERLVACQQKGICMCQVVHGLELRVHSVLCRVGTQLRA